MKIQATLLNFSDEFLVYFYLKLLKVKLCSLYLVGLGRGKYQAQVDKLYSSFDVCMDAGICQAVVGGGLEEDVLNYLFRCCSSFSGSVSFPVKTVKEVTFFTAEPHEMWGIGDYAVNRRIILDECIEVLENHLKKRGVKV